MLTHVESIKHEQCRIIIHTTKEEKMYETKKQMVIVFQSNTFFPAYLDLHLRGVYEIKYISSKSY